MMSAAKQKGTVFESAAVKYLKDNGFGQVYRPAVAGAKDSGDLNGIRRPFTMLTDGRQAIIQCKNTKTIALSAGLNGAVEQASQEAVGGNALPILLQKRPGKGEKNFGDNYAVLRFSDLVQLLKDAGYS